MANCNDIEHQLSCHMSYPLANRILCRHSLKCAGIILVCAFWSLTLAACSNINLGDASQLGSTGNQAATTYENTIKATSTEIDRYRELQYLTAPLRNLPAPDSTLLGYLTVTENALSARANLMAQLANVYSSFGALASYDAQGNVTGSINGLAGAGNDFAHAVGVTGNPIPEVAGSVIANAGGLIASDIQKHKVKAASAEIRERLTMLVPLLQKEQSTMVDLQRGLGASVGSAAVELWNHGIGSPDPIFADDIGTFGLQYVPGSYKTACKQFPPSQQQVCFTSVQQGVVDVVQLRAQRDVETQIRVLNSNIQAIQALLDAHEKLEAGDPIDLATLSANIADMQSIVNNINQTLKTNKPSK
jgi:hypothetical protein